MEMEKEEGTEEILTEAGFNVSQRCCCRPSCFDFVARKEENLILVKNQLDIGNVSSNDFLELKTISERVSAASFVISQKTREKLLEDDTVYSRYDVLAVTEKTFRNIILHKIHPLIKAGPGGYYVEIDGASIKKRRQELDLSIGDLAGMMSTSRRTLYGYERGMTKASVSAAYSLIGILGIPIAKPIDVFQKSHTKSKCLLTTAKRAITKNKLFQKIFRKLARYNVTTVEKAPFDFLISIVEEETKIIGGVATRDEQKLDKRISEILSVSKIIKAHPVLIVEEQARIDRDIPCISSKRLSRIKNPRDLIKDSTRASSDPNYFHF